MADGSLSVTANGLTSRAVSSHSRPKKVVCGCHFQSNLNLTSAFRNFGHWNCFYGNVMKKTNKQKGTNLSLGRNLPQTDHSTGKYFTRPAPTVNHQTNKRVGYFSTNVKTFPTFFLFSLWCFCESILINQLSVAMGEKQHKTQTCFCLVFNETSNISNPEEKRNKTTSSLPKETYPAEVIHT